MVALLLFAAPYVIPSVSPAGASTGQATRPLSQGAAVGAPVPQGTSQGGLVQSSVTPQQQSSDTGTEGPFHGALDVGTMHPLSGRGSGTSPDLGRSPSVTTPAQQSSPAVAPASPSTPGGLPSWSVVTGFVGITNTGYYPPDVQLAVGPNQVMEFVNGGVGVWSKQGTSLSLVSTNSFFLLPSTDDAGDPKVIYDSQSSTWFASVDDFSTGKVYLAWSASSDATGKWYVVGPLTPNNGYCADQPTLGVSDNLVVISVNDFSPCPVGSSSGFVGVQFWDINKAQLISGGTWFYCYLNPITSVFSLFPAQSISSTTTQYLVAQWSNAGRSEVWTLSGNPPSASGCPSYSYSSINTGGYTTPPPKAPQLGSPYLIDTGDNRVVDAFWYKGNLWYAYDYPATPTGDSTTRSTFVIAEVATPSNTILQNYFYGGVNQYYYYPALRINSQGNVVVVYGVSSSNSYPGVGVFTILAGSPAGSSFDSYYLHQGTAPDTADGCQDQSRGACRYGDYFGAAVDPSSPSDIWVAGEYNDAGGWSTYISNIEPGAAQGVAALNLNYASQGGGSGSTAPILLMTRGGVQYRYSLSTGATTYYADIGTTWSVNFTLPGSTSTERWATGQAVTGTVSSTFTQTFVYYHQFPVTLSYGVNGGGSPTGPTLTGTQFGAVSMATLTTSPSAFWLDGGSSYSVTPALGGSTSTERWASDQSLTGTVSGSSSAVFTYYHQFSVALSFAVTGTGNPTAPSFSAYQYGSSAAATLTASPVAYWLDASSKYTATNPLASSTSTERWYSSSVTGTIVSSGSIILNYHHQFLLTYVGGGATSTFYDEGSTASVTAQGVFNRANGAGSRISSYSIDGGASVAVAPTTGPISLTVTMNSAHTVAFTSVTQYQVSLDNGATAALDSITSPTIPGDSYWYDSGTPVSVTLNGVYGRSSGAGTRLSSYTINSGSSHSVSTTGTVGVYSGPITSPQSISTTTVAQYQLTDNDPSNSESSVTPPTISGDAGWYDSGTSVTIGLNNVKDATQSQRNNLVTYMVDGTVTSVARSDSGSASIVLTMSAPHVVSAAYQLQYLLSVTGGSALATTPASPTGDFWFDSGTTVTVSTDGIYGRSSGTGTRVSAWSVDAGTTTTVDNLSTVTTSQVTMSTPHTVTFATVPQYQLSLNSAAEAALVTCTSPTILSDNYWYDSGTTGVTCTLDGTYGRMSGAGMRISSYSVDGGSGNTEFTAGTFDTRSLSMTSAHELEATAVSQYQLSTPSGSVSTVTQPSISGDTGWYDAGTQVVVTYDHVWNVVSGQSRTAATGYTVNGGTLVPVTESGTGTFEVSLTVIAPTTVDVSSRTQYLVSFLFTDATGSATVSPASLQITVGAQSFEVPGFNIWLDSGTTFTVSQVGWEGADVKPATVTTYTVSTPETLALKTRVYSATIRVTDSFGQTVSGAQVTLRLANGTTISGTTGGDGTYTANQIPLGTFSGSVQSLAFGSQVSGDASSQSVVNASVALGTTSLIEVVVVVTGLLGTAVFLFRRRKHLATPPPPPAG